MLVPPASPIIGGLERHIDLHENEKKSTNAIALHRELNQLKRANWLGCIAFPNAPHRKPYAIWTRHIRIFSDE